MWPRVAVLWRLRRLTMGTVPSVLTCAITAPGFRKQFANDFSNNSSLQRMKAWEWVLRSCVRLRKHMAERLQPKTPKEAERVFIFVCQSRRNCQHDQSNCNGFRDRR